jgi:hypothetical protein
MKQGCNFGPVFSKKRVRIDEIPINLIQFFVLLKIKQNESEWFGFFFFDKQRILFKDQNYKGTCLFGSHPEYK